MRADNLVAGSDANLGTEMAALMALTLVDGLVFVKEWKTDYSTVAMKVRTMVG